MQHFILLRKMECEELPKNSSRGLINGTAREPIKQAGYISATSAIHARSLLRNAISPYISGDRNHRTQSQKAGHYGGALDFYGARADDEVEGFDLNCIDRAAASCRLPSNLPLGNKVAN